MQTDSATEESESDERTEESKSDSEREGARGNEREREPEGSKRDGAGDPEELVAHLHRVALNPAILTWRHGEGQERPGQEEADEGEKERSRQRIREG